MSTQVEIPPASAALRQSEVISAVGTLLGALEHVTSPEAFEEGGLISWEVGRTRFKWLAHKKADALGKVMSPPGLQVMVALRVAAAAVVISGTSDRKARAAAHAYITATNWLLHTRNSFGGDGTDHMNMLVEAAQTASALFPDDKRVQEACNWFIAAQSCLSYITAGAAKLISPQWRDGTAMTGIFRTRTYGDERLYKLFKKHPAAATAVGWATIIGELSFPLALVAPKKAALGLLGTGVSFHVGNAVFMGLNRFVWAFSGTYPAVAHCSRALRKRAS